MPSDRPWSDTDAARVALAWYGQTGVALTSVDLDAGRAVLAAVAPLIAARVRAETAEEIVAHADEHAPAAGNEAQRRVRRHLHIAARVAAGPMTLAEVAEAFKDAITHTHHAGEDAR